MKPDVLKRFLCLLVILPVLSSFEAISQDKDWGYLTVRGTVLFDDVGLGGAKVVLYKNGTKMEEKTTSNSGKFTFKATRDVFQLSPKDDKYVIKISKLGHVTIKHAVSTKVPADKKPSWPTYDFDVDLFKMPIDKVKQEKALMSILKKPISRFAYNPRKGDFKDDMAYFSTIQARVEQLFEILEADEREQYRLVAAYRLKKIEEEERRKAEAEAKARTGEVKLAEEAAKRAEKENLAREAEERKAKDEKYQTAIAKADEACKKLGSLLSKSVSIGDLNKIKTLYQNALNIKFDEKYPKDRIKEIRDALAAKTAEREVLAKTKEGGNIEEETTAMVKEEEAEALRSFNEAEEAKKAEAEKNKAIKAEREKEILEALAEKERLEREKREENIRQRKETEVNAVIIKMKIEIQVKAESNPLVIAAREKEARIVVNKEVKAQDTKHLIAIVAEQEVAQKRAKYITATPGHTSIQDRTEKKDRSKQDSPGPQWVYKFAPEIVKTIEKGFLKTVKSTVIIFPTKHNTLQEVRYAWGKVYYYKNSVEIDEETYFEELKNPR